MKTCQTCNKEKELTAFAKSKLGKPFNTCYECNKQKALATYRKRARPKTYADYLAEAGLTEYHKKSLRYQV